MEELIYWLAIVAFGCVVYVLGIAVMIVPYAWYYDSKHSVTKKDLK